MCKGSEMWSQSVADKRLSGRFSCHSTKSLLSIQMALDNAFYAFQYQGQENKITEQTSNTDLFTNTNVWTGIV